MSRDPGAELWLADIQEVVKQANQQSQNALKRESDQNRSLSASIPSAEGLRAQNLLTHLCGSDPFLQCAWQWRPPTRR